MLSDAKSRRGAGMGVEFGTTSLQEVVFEHKGGGAD
jgi:hypothetical protein